MSLTMTDIGIAIATGFGAVGLALTLGLLWADISRNRRRRKWIKEHLSDGRTLYKTSPDATPEEIEEKKREIESLRDDPEGNEQ